MPSDEPAPLPSAEIPGNRPPDTSYRASIDFVSPPARRADLANPADRAEQADRGRCFLGISLENSTFTPAKLTAMIRWITGRFPRCTVLVGDSIHRLTLASTRNLPEDEARSRALALGDRFIADTGALFAAERERTEFTFLRCSEVQRWEPYPELHRSLTDYHRTDRKFRESVEAFGRRYHRKASPQLTQADLWRRVETSSRYLLEELAIFGCLAREDHSVMVYPGSFSTVSEITGGEHPHAPEELLGLTVVSLSLRRR